MYCSQIWRHLLIKDIKKLENIQRRAKFINDFLSDYKSWLIMLDMLPLIYELELNDFVLEACSLHHFDIRNWVKFSLNKTRFSCRQCMIHNRSITLASHHSYFNHLPHLWNSIPEIDTSLPLATIKQLVRKTMGSPFVTNFTTLSPCSFHYICPCARCSHTPHAAILRSNC